MAQIQAPSGFRDFLNDDARLRIKLIHEISTVYQLHGFLPLETPALEHLNVLMGSGGGGEENEKLIFKVLKRGAKFLEAFITEASQINPTDQQALPRENELADMGLRFDLTLPLSRVVASHRSEIKLPWKVFHIGPVWRAERPQKGRYREFIQCDVDIIGAPGIGAEVEIIQTVIQTLHSLGANDFELRINDRRIIQALAEKLGFQDSQVNSFATILDKKDKVSIEEISNELEELKQSPLDPLLMTILQGGLDLEQAKNFHETASLELEKIIHHLQALELPFSKILFDPSLVRGMGYYTGPVFELRHASAGYSFGGGGRYDQLIGRFAGQSIPACGMSIGFERLLLLLKEKESASSHLEKGIFIPILDEKIRIPALQLAKKIRALGLRVDVYPDAAKLKNQLRFASELGYRWIIFAGEEEFASGQIKLKDFQSGEEFLFAEVALFQKLEKEFLIASKKI